MEKKKYYLGLDIGTDSVGYAAAWEDYSLCKFHGEPIWGTTLFDAANQCADRRGFRTARRRLDRRQQRVLLLQEIFAHEIGKVDPNFYIRLQESSLFAEDKTNIKDKNSIFNDPAYQDKHYHAEYPTIHHLICELMQSDKPHDIRLVYLACAWLVAHRGHFLSNINMDNIDSILSFDEIYAEFVLHFEERGYALPWNCTAVGFAEVLKERVGITKKYGAFKKMLNNGKAFKNTSEEHPYDRDAMLKLLSGGTVSPSVIFKKDQYVELESITLGKDEEKLEAVLSSLDEDDIELIRILQKMSDWASLVDILKECSCISQAKVLVYEQHKNDLKLLKSFIKKYCPEKYEEIFNSTKRDLKNYAAYAYHYKTIASEKADLPKAKVNKEDFSKYLLGIVKKITPDDEDKEFYEDMLERLELRIFLPKQVDSDNRVIPNQLYLYELQQILNKASAYLPFLGCADTDGFTRKEKIEAVFKFRVPYYVGPLRNDDNNDNAWVKRLAQRGEKIYPWNFSELVDEEECEQRFIKRMTNKCTYLPEQSVLPKNSLLYSKFTVLNEINNIKINGNPITVEQKQEIFEDCIKRHTRVSRKALESFCQSRGIMSKDDILEGVDIQLTATLKPYIDFASLMQREILSEAQIEDIISRSAYMEDSGRFTEWLKKAYPHISEEDVRYIVRKRYKDFGRLSAEFLNGLEGERTSTKETGTILYFLWNTNCNLMQLLSNEFTFSEQIKKIRNDYYGGRNMTIEKRLEDMYVPNAVKRPIIRTLDIVKEVVHAQGYDPERIFVEMARGQEEKKRTKSRKDQLLELYKNAEEDTSELEKQLTAMGDMAENNLQSEALYLYYLQLGRCMYTGKAIDLAQLKTNTYNVDHIYPQHYVKDDSILNNKVLVLSTANAEKGDKYPIEPAVKDRMISFWKKLHDNGLMGDEKFKRLTRNTGFTDDEKYGFINRQLVETRQSTRAVATLFKALYPDTEIVYVKAGLVSDFRHEFGLVKCRSVNDLHHAKDAYLNIVAGNVYHCRFTKNFYLDQKYSLKPKEIFGHDITVNGEKIWKADESISLVKRMYSKNSVHLTRYAFRRKGGLFDQMPLKAAEGLVPRKKGLDPVKYGGYNKKTASFFILVKYNYKKGKKELSDVMIMPVDLMIAEQFKNDEAFATEYATRNLEEILNKEIVGVSFPLGMRILKINTVFSLDGLRVCLSGKANGGVTIILTSHTSLIMNNAQLSYLKKLESYNEKLKQNRTIQLSEKYDGISSERNIELYSILTYKANTTKLQILPGNQTSIISEGLAKFNEASISEQIICLLQIISLYKTGRSGGCDITCIGGAKNAGVVSLSSNLSNWKKYYTDVRIIDQSASGLYESKSCNLLELL